jgi:hypothetical protein
MDDEKSYVVMVQAGEALRKLAEALDVPTVEHSDEEIGIATTDAKNQAFRINVLATALNKDTQKKLLLISHAILESLSSASSEKLLSARNRWICRIEECRFGLMAEAQQISEEFGFDVDEIELSIGMSYQRFLVLDDIQLGDTIWRWSKESSTSPDELIISKPQLKELLKGRVEPKTVDNWNETDRFPKAVSTNGKTNFYLRTEVRAFLHRRGIEARI